MDILQELKETIADIRNWDDKHEYLGKFIVEIELKPVFFVNEVSYEKTI